MSTSPEEFDGSSFQMQEAIRTAKQGGTGT
jgi:hypothetical protein